MSDFPIVTIKSEEDISMLLFYLNCGDKVGFTISMDIPHKECWRLMSMIWEWSKDISCDKEVLARVA